MSSNGNVIYEVRHLPIVGQQIKDLAEKAADRRTEFLSAMKVVLAKLRTEPTAWGDPEYNLQKPGGCVYHGIVRPVVAKFAVFEREKIVLLMSVALMAAFGT